jgi:hypothetical protein
MRVQLSHLILIFVLLLLCNTIFAQQDSSLLNRILSFPDKVFGAIDKKASRLETKLSGTTEKALARMQRQEDKLKRKLLKRGDTLVANEIFGSGNISYDSLYRRAKDNKGGLAAYSPHLDSLTNALQFLNKIDTLPVNNNPAQLLNKSLYDVQNLQAKLNQTEQFRKYLQQRQRYLKERMQQLGMVKEYRKLQKEIFYYQAKVKELKHGFEQPDKAEKVVVHLLRKVPAFQDFFVQNSPLASVFQLPGSGAINGATAVNTAFPTRAMVQQTLLTRIVSTANPQQVIQQNIQAGSSYFNSVRGRAQQLFNSNGSSDLDMPDFKVNNQKTKSFWKRIELGTNLQTVRGTYYFPATSDIGLSAGYKLSDKSIIGIGTSTKIGWGRGWNNIDVTAQGLSLRSFLDVKLKGNFWLSGGAEMNYRSQFRTIDVLKNYNAWQQSALIGVSKKYSIGKKWKGNAQVLYDFLWMRQVPQTQAFLFRIGYNF